MHMSFFLPSALVSLLMLVPVCSAAAQAADASPGFTFFGDFRSRLEFDRDSRQSDGTYRADRDRARLRGRAGFTWNSGRAVQVTMRARTGHPDSRQSPHVTFGDDFSPLQITLDRLAATAGDDVAFFSVGKTAHPFVYRNDVFWDSDISAEGLSGAIALWNSGDASFAVRGGAFLLEPARSSTFVAATHMLSLQGVYRAIIGEADRNSSTAPRLLATAGVERIGENDSEPDPLLADLDYTFLRGSLEIAAHLGRTPVRVGSDVSINTETYPRSVFHRDERTAWVVSLQSGLPFGHERARATNIFYMYAHVEKLSVVGGLAHDDWLRWGTATEARSSNYSGHEFQISHRLALGQTLVARLFLVDALVRETPTATALETGTRFRVDWNITF